MQAALPIATQKTLGTEDISRWGSSLVLVLCLFFICVWLLSKAGRLNKQISEPSEMQVLASLSVGTKERVVLLQLGKKQLLLSVSSGKVETLCILEAEDCLQINKNTKMNGLNKNEYLFAEKLMQVMKAK